MLCAALGQDRTFNIGLLSVVIFILTDNGGVGFADISVNGEGRVKRFSEITSSRCTSEEASEKTNSCCAAVFSWAYTLADNKVELMYIIHKHKAIQILYSFTLFIETNITVFF